MGTLLIQGSALLFLLDWNLSSQKWRYSIPNQPLLIPFSSHRCQIMRIRGDAMAKSHFSFKKRQKELKRKEKQEKKRQRRMAKNETPEENSEAPGDEIENPSE
jgi:hypothetical protein